MKEIIDLERYPLDRADGDAYADLVSYARAALRTDGMVNLFGFLRDASRRKSIATLAPLFDHAAFHHTRSHNIYFRKNVEGLASDHPALREVETANHTLCADQLGETDLARLYDWPAFVTFLAAVMEKPALFPMGDPLAGLNAMSYHDGEALNWHFDRAEFTTTLLLQSPEVGGVFEYARDLRSDDDPNFAQVAELIEGQYPTQTAAIEPGTLNIFRGRNTAHRVTPCSGPLPRMVVVFSYFETPNVQFTPAERLGFYGRTG